MSRILFTVGSGLGGCLLPWGVPAPRGVVVPGGLVGGGSGPRGCLLQEVPAWGGLAQGVPAPRGVSRPTPKGEVEGDQVKVHTQGGN